MASEAAMTNKVLRNELGTYVMAFLQGCEGKLKPIQVAQLMKNIEEICNERGFPVTIQGQ